MNAFRLPAVAPDLLAPPCILQRAFPFTAGDLQGFPERVLAPHLVDANIARTSLG
ncbi:hypothetical protein [Erythrobacter sp. WG]|uniref:hypothetical protein n=1 Tax=Erythrobacter sp. WG TaxID=2985510 RepID=UPI002270F935|nr:hypothetical protein [Erythrobacter sp. WG]MCX9148804.1 hypothetical protein [Erythrobacter sp. WG]